MMMSAFPIEDTDLMLYWLPFVEPLNEEGRAEVAKFIEETSKQKIEPIFCAALCALGLGGIEHSAALKLTANDVVEYCRNNLRAVLVPAPETSAAHKAVCFRDEGEFLWYDPV